MNLQIILHQTDSVLPAHNLKTKMAKSFEKFFFVTATKEHGSVILLFVAKYMIGLIIVFK